MIPRSELVQKSEIEAKTVMEKFPETEQALKYDKLSKKIFANQEFVVPEPIAVEEFEEFFRTFQ